MKYALVTGAYGGMGIKTARLLASEGYTVFALDKRVGDAEDGIIPVEVDLCLEEDILRAFEFVKERAADLSAVIHFAGIYMLDSLVEMKTEDFERIYRINAFAPFLVNKIFMPLLKEDSRIIITTSELAPLDPLPFTGIYAITKAALDKYAYSLKMELQLLGIKVSVLRAGAVGTGMLKASTDALDRFCENTGLYSCNAKRFKKIVDKVEARQIPPERIGKKVLKILKKRRPAFSYAINRNPLLILLNFMPKRFQLWVIKKVLK